jgi:hypothetical protein
LGREWTWNDRADRGTPDAAGLDGKALLETPIGQYGERCSNTGLAAERGVFASDVHRGRRFLLR